MLTNNWCYMNNKNKSLKGQYISEYAALRNAIDRCSRHSHSQAKDYVKRGLDVEPSWREQKTGFKAFFDEIGPKTSPDLELDRIDNDKGYVSGNVRWISHADNMRNRRRPIAKMKSLGWGIGKREIIDSNGRKKIVPCQLVPFNGMLQPIQDVAEQLGVSVITRRQRVQKGWAHERVFAATLYSPNGKPRPTPTIN